MEIKRSIYSKLIQDFAKPEIKILLGPRQVGKSFLLKKIQKYAIHNGYKTKFYNLENPNDMLLFSGSDLDIYNLLTKEDHSVIFVDEFHYSQNISHVFKAIFDSEKNIKIFASGSSSIEIHKHLQESMAGRKSTYKIFPLGFGEYSSYDEDYESYLVYGGMPGLIHLEDSTSKKEKLFELLETYLLKDIKSLVKDENLILFNRMLELLAHQQGSVVSISNLANEVRLSSHTIEKYLGIMESTFTIHELSNYSSNFANELKKSKKYYFYDLGIRNCLLKNFAKVSNREAKEKGFLYESFVFLELMKIKKIDVDVKFWRTKQGDEVDFVWVENTLPLAIEVKSHLRQAEIPRGMNKFIERYPKTIAGVVFNYNLNDVITINDKKIHFITFDRISEFKKLISE